VEPQTILDVSGAVPEAAVDALMKACRSNSFAEVQQAITNSIADGFPVCIAATRRPVCMGLIWLCDVLTTVSFLLFHFAFMPAANDVHIWARLCGHWL